MYFECAVRQSESPSRRRRIIGRPGRLRFGSVIGFVMGVFGGHIIADRAGPFNLHQTPLGIISVFLSFGCIRRKRRDQRHRGTEI
jgi:hypothetical protein